MTGCYLGLSIFVCKTSASFWDLERRFIAASLLQAAEREMQVSKYTNDTGLRVRVYLAPVLLSELCSSRRLWSDLAMPV